MEEEIEIVIVGAGICGLATALALHRKGIESVVLERSETLRASGTAIGLMSNGWRALHHLGVADRLRQTAIPLQGARDIWPDSNKQRAGPLSNGEARCVKRSDLINILAEDLPQNTIRFGCQILSIEKDPLTDFHILQLHDASSLKAKILIGCDGASSVVAEYLNLKPRKIFPASSVRGLTNYSNSHGFAHEFIRVHGKNVLCGRFPITQNLVFWFLFLPNYCLEDSEILKEPELIKGIAQQRIQGSNFPKEISDMIRDCEMTTLSLTRMTYKPALDILMETYRKGTATVAGDAMHLMCPFLAQGGSMALEDSVVLARHLARAINHHDYDHDHGNGLIARERVREAIDLYVKERRMRLVALSAQTYLTCLLASSASAPRKLLFLLLIFVLFRGSNRHTHYDCGRL